MTSRIAVLGAVGALLGTIVGSATKTATWVAVPFKRVELGPTPDRGLAGPLNTNIMRRGTEVILDAERENHAVEIVTVGRKGQDFLVRRGRHIWLWPQRHPPACRADRC